MSNWTIILASNQLKYHQKTNIWMHLKTTCIIWYEIEFKNVKSLLQHQLQNDAKWIKQDPKILIPAVKTNNLYRLTTDEYNKLLTENISKSHKTDKSWLKIINTVAEIIAKDITLEERIERETQY